MVRKVVLALLAVLLGGPLAAMGYFYAQHQPLPPAGTQSARALGVEDPRFAAEAREVGAALDSVRESLSAPGLSVSVASEGKIVWSQATGLLDLATRKPVTPRSRFEIGSVSKPISAVAVLRLAERGLVDLDEDIRGLVPEIAHQPQPISMRQLLSHQAGIRHYGFKFNPPAFSEAGLNQEFESPRAALGIFAEDELLFEPDTGFQYSTYGYTLLDAAVAAKTGKGLAELVGREIFEPSSMRQAEVKRGGSRQPDLASGYTAALSRKKVMPQLETNPSYKVAGAGYIASTDDLARFGIAVIAGELLGEEWTRQMFEPRKTSDGNVNPQRYGLGWRIGELELEGDRIAMIHHGGTTPGTISIILLFPDQQLVVTAAANSVKAGGSSSLRAFATGVAKVFLAAAAQHREA